MEVSREKSLTKDKSRLETRNAKLVILSPSLERNITGYRLAWKLDTTYTDSSGRLSAVTYYIGADTQEELKRHDHIYRIGPIHGEVFSYIYQRGPKMENQQTKAGFNDVLVEAFYNNEFVDLSYTQNHCDTGCQDPDVCCYDGYFNIDQITRSEPHDLKIALYEADKPFSPYILVEGTDIDGDDVPAWFQGSLWLPDFDPGFFYNIDLSAPGYDTTRNNEASNVYYHLKRAWAFFDKGSPFQHFPEKLTVRAIINNTEACQADNDLTYGEETQQWVSVISLAENGSGSGGFCSATSLDSDIILHEFAHLVTEYTYGFGVLQNSFMQGTMKEAFSDYWAASINNQSQIAEGSATIVACKRPPGSCPVRNLDNTLWYPYNYFDLSKNEHYYSSQILSGAMWQYRTWLGNRLGLELGFQYAIDLADDMMMITMKDKPITFQEFLNDLIVRDRAVFTLSGLEANTYQICQYFCGDHGICNSECEGLGISPPETPPPAGEGSYKVPVNGSFVDNTYLEVASIGKAEGEYSVQKRTFRDGVWNTAGITLVGEELSDGNMLLATTQKDKLIDGCFYEGKLALGENEDTVTFKKIGGTHDKMFRMACVRMTGTEGAREKGCDIVAVMSDPKPAYYNMTEDDWRRGRDPFIAGDDEDEALKASHQRQFSHTTKKLCDPWAAPQKECSKDCWNIIGEAGNHSSNDGLDDIFCGPNASPSCLDRGLTVSFTGCASGASGTCVSDAIAALDEVYHKVLYYHWTDKDSYPNGCNHDSCFLCRSWPRFGYRLIDASFGGLDNQCSGPRCEIITVEDVFDGFYRAEKFGLIVNISDFQQYNKPRDSDPAVVNCELCECSGAKPFCNRTGDRCEASCTQADGNCLTHVTGVDLVHDAYIAGPPDLNYTVTDTATTLLIDDTHVAFIRFLGDLYDRRKGSLNLYNAGGSAEVVIRYLYNDYGSWQNHDWIRPIDYHTNSGDGSIVAVMTLEPGWNSIDISADINPILDANRGYVHPFSIKKWSGTGSVLIASSESAYSPYLDMWAVRKCREGAVAFASCSGSNYCDNGDIKTRCGPICSGATCPSGSVCSSHGTGLCIKCNSNSDCEDGNSCTTGTCNNPGQAGAYCTQTVTAPNDCPTNWQCGLSPNGCHSCGSCSRLQRCSGHSCVTRVCSPKDPEACIGPRLK